MSNFSNPFKKQPTAKEAAKGVKKEVRSSQRELDRELRDIDRREAQLIADIKKQARDGRETGTCAEDAPRNETTSGRRRARVLHAARSGEKGARRRGRGQMNESHDVRSGGGWR